mgnify:CR=1 FL=1|jgi:hypothetical protein
MSIRNLKVGEYVTYDKSSPRNEKSGNVSNTRAKDFYGELKVTYVDAGGAYKLSNSLWYSESWLNRAGASKVQEDELLNRLETMEIQMAALVSNIKQLMEMNGVLEYDG